MQGVLYGIGVGPGDPELLTLKAVRLIREADIIAVPGETVEESFAYQIAVQTLPEIIDKKRMAIPMPMCRDEAVLRDHHEKGAKMLEKILKKGHNVAFLTLGDPTVYSTFTYLQEIVEMDGYQTKLVSGIPSFCAAAAEANIPLAVKDEPIHILPADYALKNTKMNEGNCILMKFGKQIGKVKDILIERKRDGILVENCGTEQQRIYAHLKDIPETVGYYSLLISKRNKS